MAKRGKGKRRRRSRVTSLMNVAESYAYASVLTSGLFNESPVGFLTGGGDLGWKQGSGTMKGEYVSVGGSAISLRDIVQDPDQAFSIVRSNAMGSWQDMAIRSFGIGVGFKLAKGLLRRPINNVNRNIFNKLGVGFKI